ncbi:hypothetical protein Emed_003433 [Eimeria media]
MSAAGGEEGEDSDDDGTGPLSPDFTEFCLDLGTWNPSDTSVGGPRASPAIVEEFFTSLDQSAEPPPPPAPMSTAPGLTQLLLAPPEKGEKRPLDEEEDDDVIPGPSWKVAKTTVQTSPSQLMYPGGQPAPAAPLSLHPPPSTSSSSTAPHLVQTTPAHQASPDNVVAILSAGGAASVSPPEGPGGDGDASQHLFVRLPTLAPGVTARPFSASMVNSAAWSTRHINMLLKVRELLRKQQLSEYDANCLVYYAEALAAHAAHTMRDKVENQSPYHACVRLGRKFLVLHAMLRASYALQQDWPAQNWWKDLMAKIPHFFLFIWQRDPRALLFNVNLANDLSAAVEKIKSGVLPPPREVVNLMRRLFCMELSLDVFREKAWDPWREDDDES